MAHIIEARFLKDIAYTEVLFKEAWYNALLRKPIITINGSTVTLGNFGVLANGYSLVGIGSQNFNVTQDGYIYVKYDRDSDANTEVFSTNFGTTVPASDIISNYGIIAQVTVKDGVVNTYPITLDLIAQNSVDIQALKDGYSYETTGYNETMTIINSQMASGDVKVIYGDLWSGAINYVPFLANIIGVTPTSSLVGVCTITKINDEYLKLELSLGFTSNKKIVMFGDWHTAQSNTLKWSTPLQQVEVPYQTFVDNVIYNVDTNNIPIDWIHTFECTGALALSLSTHKSTLSIRREVLGSVAEKWLGTGSDFSGGDGTYTTMTGWFVPIGNSLRANLVWTYLLGGSVLYRTTGDFRMRYVIVGGYREVIL